jgi:hypothetical protein
VVQICRPISHDFTRDISSHVNGTDATTRSFIGTQTLCITSGRNKTSLGPFWPDCEGSGRTTAYLLHIAALQTCLHLRAVQAARRVLEQRHAPLLAGPGRVSAPAVVKAGLSPAVCARLVTTDSIRHQICSLLYPIGTCVLSSIWGTVGTEFWGVFDIGRGVSLE